jgi:hypothetical protein
METNSCSSIPIPIFKKSLSKEIYSETVVDIAYVAIDIRNHFRSEAFGEESGI